MIAAGKVVFRCVLLSLTLPLACDSARAQIQPAQPQPAGPQIGTIHGIVKSGNDADSRGAAFPSLLRPSDKKISRLDRCGWQLFRSRSVLWLLHRRVEMIAFANSTQQVVIDASHQNVPANFELTLLSRTHEASAATAKAEWTGRRAARLSNSFCAAERGQHRMRAAMR